MRHDKTTTEDIMLRHHCILNHSHHNETEITNYSIYEFRKIDEDWLQKAIILLRAVFNVV